MGFVPKYAQLHLLILHVILFLPSQVISQNEKENLLQGLNSYRASLNLTTLDDNKNADCFADEIASQFKNQPCSNTTGADTVLGMEPQFSNFPDLLAKCHLNISDTRDRAVMPASVLNLVPPLILTTQYLNDSTYIGVGIGSEGDDWAVVVSSAAVDLKQRAIGNFYCSLTLVLWPRTLLLFSW